jgi:hypothetical protein
MKIYIMLGRNGDIINLLPVLKQEHDRSGIRPHLLVAMEFVELLGGVSYVEPLVWTGAWQDCIAAEQWVRAEYPSADIVNCAVYGVGYRLHRQCASFQREAWRMAGMRTPWGHLPLVFDRRDKKRELALIRSQPAYVVTAFSGTSAPFAGGAAIIAELRKKYEVVDISQLRCERIYDMIAILEHAICMVCSDSAPLHLAWAVPDLPVVSLAPDRSDPWNRADWRPQHVARIFYSEATLDPSCVVKSVDMSQQLAGVWPRFIHVTSAPVSIDTETLRRMEVARASWQLEMDYAGRWSEILLMNEDLTRDTKRMHGEVMGAPYVKDVINAAAERCRPRDVIVFSNADVCCAPGLTGWIVDSMIRGGAAFTHRWDYDLEIKEPLRGEEEVGLGRWYPGSDCFAFTAAWWMVHGDEYPDMVMGREACDMVLRQLIKRTGGVEIPQCIYHEKHPSFWEKVGNKESLPSNRLNRAMAKNWLAENGGEWNDGREVRWP